MAGYSPCSRALFARAHFGRIPKHPTSGTLRAEAGPNENAASLAACIYLGEPRKWSASRDNPQPVRFHTTTQRERQPRVRLCSDGANIQRHMESAKGQDQAQEGFTYGTTTLRIAGDLTIARPMATPTLQRQGNSFLISACISFRRTILESTSADTVPINTSTSARNPISPNSEAVVSRRRHGKTSMPRQRNSAWRSRRSTLPGEATKSPFKTLMASHSI